MAPIRSDRVAIYIRWSTDDQAGGTTLDVQRDGCHHYALSQGWLPRQDLIFIDDGYSGGNLERPALNRLRAAVQQGQVDCVVVFKIDRLSRNVVDTVNLVLREWDGKCHVKSAREAIDTATQQGRMFFYTLVSFAEWERSVIRERTWSGRLRRLQEGRNPGFRPPYGLRTGETPGSFALVPDEAAIVRHIFALYARGLGYKAIAVELGREGLRFRGGRPWSAQTVMAVLRNPIYAGRLVYGRRRGRLAAGGEPVTVESRQLPLIIPAGEFEAAQAQRTRRAEERAPNRAVSSGHLLTGLLRCGGCGSAMMGRAPYYICAGQRSRGTAFCNCGYIRQDELDRWIAELLVQRCGAEAGHERFRAQPAGADPQRAAAAERALAGARRELAALGRELSVIGRDYRQERISAAEYRELKAEVERERDRLLEQERDLASALRTLTAAPDRAPPAIAPAERWALLTRAEQKQVLRLLIRRLTVFRAPDSAEVRFDLTWSGR